MALRFGLFDQLEHPGGVPLHQLYRDRIALVAKAEQAGFWGYHKSEHHLIPLDAAPELGDEADDRDPERAFERTQQQLVLLRLAKERLSDRERTVFFGIHFDGTTRAALAEEVGLTPQAVGQMYVRVVKSLYDAPRADPSFPTTEGGGAR